MNIFKTEKKIFGKMFSCVHILAIFLLAFITSPALAELKLESVYPNQGVLGQDLAVTLKGTGFDGNTRVSMTLDVGNKKAIIGSVDTPGSAQGITVVGNTAYVAAFAGGLQIIDISNPASPKIVGSVDTPGSAVGITVVGDTAYVADAGGGLQVIDISSSGNPQIIGSVDTPDEASGVAVVNQIAYIADGDSGLQVIDVSDLSNPTIIGSIDTPDKAIGVKVVDQIAYIADNSYDANGSLQVIDVSNPSNPTIIGSVKVYYIHDVAVVDQIAYVTASNGDTYYLQVIDVSDSSNPIIIGSVNTPGTAWKVSLVNQTAYVACWGGGIQIIDISQPSNPITIGIVNTPNYAYDVTIVGQIAYVADGAGLQTIDVSDPSNSTVIGSVDTPGLAYGVTVVDQIAYIADNNGGLQVIDVSNPSNPTIIGSVNIYNTSAWGITVVDQIAYISDMNKRLQIINVGDPFNPAFISSVDISGAGTRVTIVGSIAYVASSDSGLQVIDVSDLSNPTIIGSVDTPGLAYDVTVVDQIAYIADNSEGLQVIDVSNPSNPTIIGSVDTPGKARSVTVADQIAYVSDYFNGLQIIDISNPSNPTIIGSEYITGGVQDVTVVEQTAYVLTVYGGLQVIDVSNPSNPTTIGSVNILGYSYGFSIVGQTAYVANNENGLIIVPLPVEITPDTLNNETSISVTLPSPDMAGNYTLRVFNDEENFELAGAVNFSNIDLANIDPNGLVIQTLDGEAVTETLDQDQDLYLQLIYIDPEGTPFNLSNLPNFKVEWLSSHPEALSINSLGHLIAKAPGTAKITVQITSGKKSVNINVPGVPVPKNYGNLIIISGRKYEDETLGQYFTGIGNSVYEIFYNRGFDHDDIYYFCPYGQQSLPGESTDIVDRVIGFSESNLSTEIMQIITTWAAEKENSGPLYIYLVDHGTPGQPIMPVTPTSPVNAVQIDSALDVFEQATSRKAVVVIEACYSGKWLNALQSENRVVIASTGAYHAENLPTDNLISFSHYFFNDLAKGKAFSSAFDYAKDKTQDISYAANQTPQFISSMDISSSYLVGNFASVGTMPLFVSYTGKDGPVVVQKDTFVSLEASLNMPYAEGFEVWVSITPPVSGEQELGETPYVVPFKVDLEYTGLSDPEGYFGGDKLYSGQSTVFDTTGIYDLVYFARNISSQIIHSDHVAVFVQEDDTPIVDYTFEIKAADLESLPSELDALQQLNLTLEAQGLNEPVNIQWFSSNPAVVSVDANGHVTANAAGQAKITAIYIGGSLSHYFTVSGEPGTKSVGNLILIGGISDKEINPNSNGSLYYCFKTIAKQIYKTFQNRGFSHEDIFYFSPYGKDTLAGESVNIVDRQFAIDESGLSDEILEQITTWASSQDNTGPLYLCLIGHGTTGQLTVNTVTKLLASDLDAALDTFQENGRPAVVMVEACKSGTWIEPLKDENRLIITSTSEEVEGLKYGWNSFSYYLATELSKGSTFESAFTNASNTIVKWVQTQKDYDQAPQNYKDTAFAWTNPLVGNFASASASFFKNHTGKNGTFQLQTGSTLNLEAAVDVMNPQDVEVFAVVTPPVPGIPENLGEFETPVLETIRVNLTLEQTKSEDKVYSAAGPALNIPGTYRLTFCLKDSIGEIFTADPVLFSVGTSQDQVALAVNQGWNLLSFDIAFSVTEKLSDDTKYSSVWKWESGGWAVYLPGQEDGGTEYAGSKGFTVLSNIEPGEGFWVNSVGSETIPIEGTPITGSLTLTPGWNLVGLKNNVTKLISDLVVENEGNIVSVWKWDGNAWAVYLSGQNTQDYADSKGFSVLSNINPGEGFWVNCKQ